MVTLFFEQQMISAVLQDVVLVTTRHIWRVPKKGTAVNRSCSRSHTLIVAHEATWEDLVYHFEIVGK
jgi:hypothetical protein